MKPMFQSPFTITVMAAILLLGPVTLGAEAQEAQKLSKNGVRALIAGAKTPSDHKKLAAYYRAEAQRLKAEQKDHEEEAEEYLKHPPAQASSKWPTMGQHCRDLAGYYGMAAQKALAMADMHEQMAKDAQGSGAASK